MKWFKRYTIGSLIALCVLAGMYEFDRPGEDLPFGTLILMSVVWPMTAAIGVGTAMGAFAKEMSQEKAG